MSQVRATHTYPSGQRLQIAEGDLTQEKVDAIVNAANARLAHGGGVAAAILQRGGPVIQQESDAWVREHGPVTHDEPAVTGAGSLPCRYIIHVVGPIWGEGEEDRKLAAALRAALHTAKRLGVHSLALPAISTGIYGFPKDRAVPIFLDVIRRYFDDNPASAVELVRLTLRDTHQLALFVRALEAPPPPAV